MDQQVERDAEHPEGGTLRLWLQTAAPAPSHLCCHRVQEETLALRKEGIGVVLDSELPHLIGIDDDLLSTGIILYHLKVGTRIRCSPPPTSTSAPPPYQPGPAQGVSLLKAGVLALGLCL